ncbi:MAG: helix-turn-helix domain-containing protein [Planctomycetota bacterium]|jgi:SOS-response transcriptional repressor LexA
MVKFDENAIIKRIRLLRNQHAGSRGKSKFAHDLGISPSTYNYYEKNRVPPIEVLLRICKLTGVNMEWLLTGQIKRKQFTFAPHKDSTFEPADALLRKLEAVLADNPDLTEPILAFVDFLCEKKGLEKDLYSETALIELIVGKDSQPAAKRPSWIPVLGRTAAGMVNSWDQTGLPKPKEAVTELDELVEKYIGKSIFSSSDGTLSVDLRAQPLVERVGRQEANLIQVRGEEGEGLFEFVECKAIYELFGDSFALHVDGDSMSPRINDGDIVIISPSVPARQGQICIARILNQIGVTCKFIRISETEVHLIPINEKYETKVVARKDLLWALAVLCHVSL